jgi:hypothetical protein
MSSLRETLAGVLIPIICSAGCGAIHSRPDCDEVARQQPSGETDQDVATAIGVSLAYVQSCSETTSSGRRRTAANRKGSALVAGHTKHPVLVRAPIR